MRDYYVFDINKRKNSRFDNQPYYECVLTLENNSDSIFEFNVDDTIHSVEPKPNSLVLVKPSSIYHRVSPLEKGERTILKFIFLYSLKSDV